MAVTISIPLINPNEPEALLIELFVIEGQLVEEGEPLCTLETTKSMQEIVAQQAGYIIGLRYTKGDTVKAGDILAHLSEDPDWQPSEFIKSTVVEFMEDELPEGLRISQPALEFVRSHGLDINKYSKNVFVTLEMVQAEFEPARKLVMDLDGMKLDPTAVVIYGAGGHGKSVLDFIRALGTYNVVGFIDDGIAAGEAVFGIPVVGSWESLAGLFDQGIRMAINAVGGIGNVSIRKKVFHRLAVAGFQCPEIVHSTAFVEPSASISAGSQVFPLAYVGSEVKIGFGSIINTGAIVSHECILGDYVNIAPNAILAGGVIVDDSALIGMGATINLAVHIGEGARVGNGSTVKADVPKRAVVSAGTIWPK